MCKQSDRTAFIFPASGHLSPGVCMDYYQKYPKVREFFDIASDIHKLDFKKFFCDDSSDFRRPVDAELATMLVSISKYVAWMDEVDIKPTLFSGLSLGLYTSLIAAGSLSMADAFLLLKRTMEVGTTVPGKMGLIVGLSYEEVDELCHSESFEGRVCIANYNMREQVAITGEDHSVETILKLALEANAMKCKILYDGQFHSPALSQWADEMMRMMNGMDVKTPETPILFLYNLKEATTPEEIKEFICKQIAEPVRWYEALQLMAHQGIENFVEFGPGALLSKMLRLDLDAVNSFTVKEPEEIWKIADRLPVM